MVRQKDEAFQKQEAKQEGVNCAVCEGSSVLLVPKMEFSLLQKQTDKSSEVPKDPEDAEFPEELLQKIEKVSLC